MICISGTQNGDLNSRGDVEPSVAGVLEHLIDAAHTAGHSLTVRGRTFAHSQKLIEFLTRSGIDALSVNPEAIPRIAKWVAEMNTFSHKRYRYSHFFRLK